MGTSTNTANNIFNLIFQTSTWTTVAANTLTAAISTVYVALHTGDPGAGGSQATNEVNYLGYVRASAARPAGWTVSASASTHPAALITFPIGTGGISTATYFSVGIGSSGATDILWSGTITPTVVCGTAITPQLTTATVISLA